MFAVAGIDTVVNTFTGIVAVVVDRDCSAEAEPVKHTTKAAAATTKLLARTRTSDLITGQTNAWSGSPQRKPAAMAGVYPGTSVPNRALPRRVVEGSVGRTFKPLRRPNTSRTPLRTRRLLA